MVRQRNARVQEDKRQEIVTRLALTQDHQELSVEPKAEISFLLKRPNSIDHSATV